LKREVGLWIDQHRTVMVSVIDEKQEIREVRSNVEKALRSSVPIKVTDSDVKGISNPTEAIESGFGNRLNEYYDGVVSLLRSADMIWIFGPGEAKVELQKRLEQAKMGGRISKVETVAKMTDRQIADKVRIHFA
jgi:hypothetical protein